MRKKILRLFDLVSNFKWEMIFLLKKITDSKFRITMNSNNLNIFFLILLF